MSWEDIDKPKMGPPGWEREAIQKLAEGALQEQRRARRWGIFFKLLGFGYLFVVLALFLRFDFMGSQVEGEHTAVVDLEGVILSGEPAGADTVVAGLRAAYEDENTKGIILRINSPGGSPVQSSYIYNEIRRLREKHPDTPLYAVVSDVCASGGYYVAAAADKIYADKSSIVGSIGVRMDSFGFVDTMEQLGVERRLLTAGEHKGLLDPFSPVNDTAQVHIQSMLNAIHEQFIDAVKAGRGERLAENNDLFSGLVWSGEEAEKLGLIDGFGSAGYVAREIIGEEDVINFTPDEDLISRFADRIGASMARIMGDRFLSPSLK